MVFELVLRRRFQVLEMWSASTQLVVLGLVSLEFAADFAFPLRAPTEQEWFPVDCLAFAVRIVVVALLAEAQVFDHHAAAVVDQVHRKVLAGVVEESDQGENLDLEEDTSLEELHMEEAYQDNLQSHQGEGDHGSLDLEGLLDRGHRTVVVGIGCTGCKEGKAVVVEMEADLDLEDHSEERVVSHSTVE